MDQSSASSVVGNTGTATNSANVASASISTSSGGGGEGFVVRVRGLPWSSTSDDILQFFAPLQIRQGTGGIQFTFTPEGRPSGEAFVEFTTSDDRDAAIKKNNEHMGRRYIEVFKSKKTEMDWVLKRVGDPPLSSSSTSSVPGLGATLAGIGPTVHSLPSKMGGVKAIETVVKLRGLPYDCSKEDVENFFAGLQIIPNGILFVMESEGRRSGEAFVEFISPEEAEKAQKKHRHMMAHRYIEVFKSSRSEMKRSESLDGRAHYSGRPAPYERPRADYDVAHNRYGSGYERRYRVGGGTRGGYDGRDDAAAAAAAAAAAGMAAAAATSGYTSTGQYYDYYDATYGQGGGGYGMRRDGIGGGAGASAAGGGGARAPHHVVMATATAMGTSTAHRVRMRGLPFSASEQDIMAFFSPLNPVSVQIEYDRSGRASGEAAVYFASHEEAGEAMGKNRQMMGHRYIELFLHSTPTRAPLAQVSVPASLAAAAAGMTAPANQVLSATPTHGVMATVNQYAIAPPGVAAVTEQQLLTTAYPATSIARTTIGVPVSVSGGTLLPSSMGGPVSISMAPTVPTANPQINAANMAAAVAGLPPRDTQTNFTF